MTNWKKIHLYFTPELQKEWEDKGFNYEQTEWWIDIGLQPKDAELAYYLQKRTYRIRGELWNGDEFDYESIEKWREEYANCKWLEKEYPLQERTNIKKLNLDDKNLKGTLTVGDVDGFTNLEEFRCWNNHLLTEIDISKCARLKKISCINNTQLVNLRLPNNISFLECQDNPLTFLSLRNCSKLKEANCSNNLLKNIELPYLSFELEKLNISNNDFVEQDLNFGNYI